MGGEVKREEISKNTNDEMTLLGRHYEMKGRSYVRFDTRTVLAVNDRYLTLCISTHALLSQTH